MILVNSMFYNLFVVVNLLEIHETTSKMFINFTTNVDLSNNTFKGTLSIFILF